MDSIGPVAPHLGSHLVDYPGRIREGLLEAPKSFIQSELDIIDVTLWRSEYDSINATRKQLYFLISLLEPGLCVPYLCLQPGPLSLQFIGAFLSSLITDSVRIGPLSILELLSQLF